MITEIQKILQLKNFFSIIEKSGDIAYVLKEPSKILMQNIYISWMQFIYAKTCKNISVYLNKPASIIKNKCAPYGYIVSNTYFNKDILIQHHMNEYLPRYKSELQFHLIIPQQESMQYFIQWQRHRKYWWSSITTTPSFFAVNEITFGNETADVEVVAQLPQCKETVETITLDSKEMLTEGISHIKCTMSLDKALFILLFDGINNTNKEEYLRLHRDMAPYKISFALKDEDLKTKESLKELVTVLQHKLELKKISTCLPDFNMSLDSQLKKNLQHGVNYTAILSGNTLTNGIFNLMNSSTKLKEQVHVADFDTYAELLCIK